MAVFGVPRVREDDALRAVRAAAEIRDVLPAVAEELGIETRVSHRHQHRRVMVGEGQTFATGDAVNVAARLEQAAAPGEILIGAPRRCGSCATRSMRSRSTRSAAGQGRAGAGLPAARRQAGRGRPRRAGSTRRWSAASASCGCCAGRLRPRGRGAPLPPVHAARRGRRRQVAARARSSSTARPTDATVVRGRCLPYGEGITFCPLVEVLMQLGDAGAEVLARVAEGGGGLGRGALLRGPPAARAAGRGAPAGHRRAG